jgi:hypothetical protein
MSHFRAAPINPTHPPRGQSASRHKPHSQQLDLDLSRVRSLHPIAAALYESCLGADMYRRTADFATAPYTAIMPIHDSPGKPWVTNLIHFPVRI